MDVAKSHYSFVSEVLFYSKWDNDIRKNNITL